MTLIIYTDMILIHTYTIVVYSIHLLYDSITKYSIHSHDTVVELKKIGHRSVNTGTTPELNTISK